MVNKKKLGAGIGVAAPFVVAGVVVGLKVDPVLGLGVAAVGGLLIFGYTELKDKFGWSRRLTAWMEAAPAVDKEERRKKTQAMIETARVAVAAGKGEVEEETRLAKVGAWTVGIFKRIVGKRAEVVEDQIRTVEEIKPEAKKSLEALTVELATSRRFLLRMVDALEKEHAVVADKIKQMRARKREFSGLERKLKKNIESYRKTLKQVKETEEAKALGKRIKELQDLETVLAQHSKEKRDIDVLQEISKTESYCHYLQSISDRITSTIKELQESIDEEWRDKKYTEMMKRLDRMSKATASLQKGVTEHRTMVGNVWQHLRDFEDVVFSFEQSELIMVRLQLEAKAKQKAGEALAAGRKVSELEDKLKASEDMNAQRQARIDDLSKELTGVNTKLATWHADFEKAKEEAEKDEKLKARLTGVLSKNIEEESQIILDIVKLMQEQEEYAESCSTRADSAEEKLTAAEEQVAALEKERDALATAADVAEEQKQEFDRERERLLEEKQTAVEAAKQATEDSVRAEMNQKIEGINTRLADVTSQLGEANAAKAAAEGNVRTVQSALVIAQKNAAEARDQARALAASEKTAKESLTSTRLQLAEVKDEMESTVRELHEMITHLKHEYEDRFRLIKAKDKRIQDLKHDLELAKKESEDAVQRAEEHLRKREGSYDELWSEYERSREAMENKISEHLAKIDALEAANTEHVEALRLADEAAGQLRESQATELGQARSAATEAQTELERIRGALDRSYTEAAELRQAKETAVQARKDAEQSLDDARKELRQARSAKLEEAREKEGPSEEEAALTSKVEQLESRVKALDNRLEARESSIKELKKALEKEKAYLNDAEGRAKKAEKDLAWAEHEKEDTERHLSNARKELEDTLVKLKQEAHDRQEYIDITHGQVSENERELRHVKERNRELLASLVRIARDIHEAKGKGETIEAQLAEREQRMEELQRLWHDEVQVTGELSDREAALQTELDRQTELYAELERRSKAEAERIRREAVAAGSRAEQQSKRGNRLDQKVKDLQSREQDLLRSIKSFEETIGNMRENLRRMSGAEQQARQVQEQLDRTQQDLAARNTELTRLQETLEEARTALSASQTAHESTISQLTTAEENAKAKAADAESYKRQAEEAKSQAQEELAKRKALEQEFTYTRWIESIGVEIASAGDKTKEERAFVMHSAIQKMHEVRNAGHIQGVELAEVQLNNLDQWIEHISNMLDNITPTVALEDVQEPPPEPEETKKFMGAIPKVIAFGDPHGDYAKFTNLLKQSGVVSHNLKWQADPQTQVVFMGDYIDRGPEQLKLLNMIWDLKHQAGDQLTLLMGNHEAMFLGAFDWVGYDDTELGQQWLEWFMQKESEFNEACKKAAGRGHDIPGSVRDDVLARDEFREFRPVFLRIQSLKNSWFQNDFNKQIMQSNMCHQLGIDGVEVMKDPSLLINAVHHHDRVHTIPMRSYIKFLRENLESYYYNGDTNILFVHAGIPYDVKVHGLCDEAQEKLEVADMRKRREPKGFIYGNRLHHIFQDIENAVRNRQVEFWMAFSEMSPLFACHPANRDFEWNKIPPITNDENIVKTQFGYDAVVYGHSRHRPDEEDLHKKYEEGEKKILRRMYNIDFGIAYNMSHGGWLTVNEDGSIKITLMGVSENKDGSKSYVQNSYTYHCSESKGEDEKTT